MAKRRHHESTMRRAEILRELAARHYEPGNQARCYKMVWRRWINPVYPMCYRTFLNYLSLKDEPPPKDSSLQLTLTDLFDNNRS